MLFHSSKGWRGERCFIRHATCEAFGWAQTKATPKDASEDKGADHLCGIKSGTFLASVSILSSNSFVEPARCEVGKRIHEAISTGVLFRTCCSIHRSLDTLCWCLEVYDTEMNSIRLERAACKASVKELEEALKGELSTNKEEMAHELAEEEVQRRLAAHKSASVAAGDVEGGVCGSLGLSSKAKGKHRVN